MGRKIFSSEEVQDAIKLCKEQNNVFVVLLTDSNETCESNDIILSKLDENKCTVIHIPSTSKEYKWFSEIYGTARCPSCFFIGQDGLPISIIRKSIVTEQELLCEMQKIKSYMDDLSKASIDCHTGPVVTISQSEENITTNEVKEAVMPLKISVKPEDEVCTNFSDPPNHSSNPVNMKCRLQFKYPDGEKFSHEFLRTDTLITVMDWLKIEKNLRNFYLAQSYPVHAFTTEELDQTLETLALFPSGTLYILYQSSGGSDQGASFVSKASFLFSWLMMLPTTAFYWILQYFRPSQRAVESQEKKNNYAGGRNHQNTVRQGIRREVGNIHRLYTDHDSDDDQNTYNGNSTQQM